ncbi:hypothetical protein BOTBODRAFT_60289 [Botryobasidium botryosum FD-172 SS1]|uniref:AAA-ATPase-like domain-containing protein n=1 Tax=Botryobasidium botryosum (strain FD-172 SS1) TaxID=930990 RepID=A0A067LUM4_BOTB1|nr:hypothetical protein BOTBODRAFT_60289 [Botryobasidium botryosum FD-172 SS1]
MAQPQLQLICRDLKPFQVPYIPIEDVQQLKAHAIAVRKNLLGSLDIAEIELWKLDPPIAVADKHHLSNFDGTAHPPLATPMENSTLVAQYFETLPGRGLIHVFVHYNTPQQASTQASSSLLGKRSHGSPPHSPSMERKRMKLLKGSKTIYHMEPEVADARYGFQLPSNGTFDQFFMTEMLVADKTMYIEKLETQKSYQYILLRPRRWGKSTFVQMLAAYYDIEEAHRFEAYFSQLYIGRKEGSNPGHDRNALLVLIFDFSEFNFGNGQTVAQLEADYHKMINRVLMAFLAKYGRHLNLPKPEAYIKPDDSIQSLNLILNLVAECNHRVFLAVDEYDVPVKSLLLSGDDEGKFHFISTLIKVKFFTIIKRRVPAPICKYWVTGVLPVLRDGASPLQSLKDISTHPEYHGICGLTQNEVETYAQSYLHDLPPQQLNAITLQMRFWYNGYIFCPDEPSDGVPLPSLFNPQLVFEYLKMLKTPSGASRKLYQVNDAVRTSSILDAFSIVGDSIETDLLPAMNGTLQIPLQPHFGSSEVAQAKTNIRIAWSLLYYLGIMTHGGPPLPWLKAPNATTRKFMLDQAKYVIQQTDTEFIQAATESYGSFLRNNSTPLIDSFEQFLQRKSVRSIEAITKAVIQNLLEAFWFTSSCLSGLCLVADSTKQKDSGRFGFVDLFVYSSQADCSHTVVELKSVTLVGLAKGAMNNGDCSPSAKELELLREALRSESEVELMEREFFWYEKETEKWRLSSMKTLKVTATQQLEKYLGVLRLGLATEHTSGILDHRVRCEKGSDSLVGHLVMCVGGTRLLHWKAGPPILTEWSYKVVG